MSCPFGDKSFTPGRHGGTICVKQTCSVVAQVLRESGDGSENSRVGSKASSTMIWWAGLGWDPGICSRKLIPRAVVHDDDQTDYRAGC